MARVTRYIDDYSGKELAEDDGQNIHIQVGDEHWEMDLGSDSLQKLLKAILPWTDKGLSVDAPRLEPAARRGRGPAKTTRTKVTGDSPEYRASVRLWANANGFTTGDRGRIKQEIYDAYEEAHKS